MVVLLLQRIKSASVNSCLGSLDEGGTREWHLRIIETFQDLSIQS
jgi:hypothetical protein